MKVRVEEVGKSEGHPVTGWIRVEFMAISPGPKGSRLPTGLSLRKSLRNQLRRKGK
jgi:hypothetical protein